jgi:hypothetical protein
VPAHRVAQDTTPKSETVMTIDEAAGATPAGASLIMPTKPTPFEILCELFGPEWAGNAHMASRTHDQEGGWGGYRVSERFPDNAQLTLPANRDNYFSVGMQSRATRDRKGGNVVLDFLIVLDDVGTKAPRLHAEGLRAFGIEPVMVLESSPGNYQYFYRLDEPVGRLDPDQKQRVAMIDTIRAALGLGLYSDGAVHDPSRYMRMPFGINTKPKYKRPDGSFPEVELIEWNPGARITLDQAGQAWLRRCVRTGRPIPARWTPGLPSSTRTLGTAITSTARTSRPMTF